MSGSPGVTKQKFTQTVTHLQGTLSLSPESHRPRCSREALAFPTPPQGTSFPRAPRSCFWVEPLTLSTVLQSPTTQKSTWAVVAMVPTLGLLLTHHDLLIGWGKKTGKQQAWFPVHLALQRFMCCVFTTHEKL